MQGRSVDVSVLSERRTSEHAGVTVSNECDYFGRYHRPVKRFAHGVVHAVLTGEAL